MRGYRLGKKQKRSIIDIALSVAFFAAVASLDGFGILLNKWFWRLGAYLVPYLVVGWRVIFRAARNIVNGQIFDENFLMCIATVGALVIGEYPEAVFVMLFYRVGELFEQIAVGKSRRSVAALMEIRPDTATVLREGEWVSMSPDKVAVGEIIFVKAGEKIPLDGEIIEGASLLNTVALTGEALPREVAVGDKVTSGCVNMSGLLKIRVSCEFGESTVSKILQLVESATDSKSKSENFITKFAKYYTPAVVICAAVLAILPPLILAPASSDVWREWVYRAMSFLVISCPCALVISVPMTFFGGIGRASADGILIKGSEYIETLADCSTVVFDKTGTLTEGRFVLDGVYTENGFSEKEILQFAASVENGSTHPVARAVCSAFDGELIPVSRSEELAGLGIRAVCDGKTVCVGNARLMADIGVSGVAETARASAAYVAVDGVFGGRIEVSDVIKPDAAKGILNLKKAGVRHTVMLTGDRWEAAESVAASLGIDELSAELLPDGKMLALEGLMVGRSANDKLAFVGDGINDAPALARADVGIAMGGIGSDAAIEAADVVIMDDKVTKISRAVELSRRTIRIVRENIAAVLFVKAAALVLGAFGITGMWFAIFADVGISVLAILNSLKIFKM
ncbi:MAG: cadmium-translocating P-type ATPase [Ruminococcaceae bacterium]|nr:cadmium-translocating P-type ATPase [Oscillospiraceae bacterium]